MKYSLNSVILLRKNQILNLDLGIKIYYDCLNVSFFFFFFFFLGGGGSSVGRERDSWSGGPGFDPRCGRPLPTGWVGVSIM